MANVFGVEYEGRMVFANKEDCRNFADELELLVQSYKLKTVDPPTAADKAVGIIDEFAKVRKAVLNRVNELEAEEEAEKAAESPEQQPETD